MADVLFAAADPGGANVLAAFLVGQSALRSRVRPAWATAASAPAFTRAGLAVELLPTPLSGAEIERRWRAAPALVVVTATSLDGVLEPTLWRLASEDGATSLAWLDQWTNLAIRFQNGRPDWLAVIDAGQGREAERLGFPSDRRIVAGQPYLFPLAEARARAPRDRREPATDAPVRLLFVSEPYASDVAAGRLPSPGFDELTVLDATLAGAAESLVGQPGRRIELIVKLHPSEPPEAMQAHIARLAPPTGLTVSLVPGTASGRALLEDVDLVVGMSSVLLIEAMLCGRPVLSLQPGLNGEDPFVAGRAGATLSAYGAADARALVRRAIGEPALRADAVARQDRFLAGIPLDGAANVAAWINSRGEGPDPVLRAIDPVEIAG